MTHFHAGHEKLRQRIDHLHDGRMKTYLGENENEVCQGNGIYFNVAQWSEFLFVLQNQLRNEVFFCYR